MSLKNQHIVDAQIEVNRSVWASNLDTNDFEKMKAHGGLKNEKDALEYMRYHAQKAIEDLNLFLEKTK